MCCPGSVRRASSSASEADIRGSRQSATRNIGTRARRIAGVPADERYQDSVAGRSSRQPSRAHSSSTR